jgi:hypothetical protein
VDPFGSCYAVPSVLLGEGMPRAPTAIVNLKLRLEERLRHQLERAARKADRSMNSEIIDRLEKSFVEPALVERIDTAVRSGNDEVARRLDELRSTFDELLSTANPVSPWPPPTTIPGRDTEAKPPARGSLPSKVKSSTTGKGAVKGPQE